MKYFLTKLLHKIGLIKKVNVVIDRTINGVRMRIPVINGMGYNNLYISEIWMCKLLEKLVHLKPGTFIDVGVNVGQTLLKLRSVTQSMEYIGFEPNPKCVYYYDALLDANQFEHCRLLPVGLFDRDTVLELNLYTEANTDPSASLIDNLRPHDKIFKKIFVPVIRFEQVVGLLGLKAIAIIKIDVEGAEFEVLQSLHSTIVVHRPILLMEILPCYAEENVSRINRQEQVEALLKTLQYQIIRIIKKDNEEAIDRFEPLETIGIHGNLDWCEYVLAPKEQADRILV